MSLICSAKRLRQMSPANKRAVKSAKFLSAQRFYFAPNMEGGGEEGRGIPLPKTSNTGYNLSLAFPQSNQKKGGTFEVYNKFTYLLGEKMLNLF